MASYVVTAKSSLDLTPWARAQLTDEQAAELIAAIPAGAFLRISATSPRGPFMAALGGDDWDYYTDRMTAHQPYAAAMALLRQKGLVDA